jgi:type IV pilus assembly protein PilW
MRSTRAQRGLSMIELMIGLLIGLFIAAVGSTLLIGQLRTSRVLLNEARLAQDLRTAVDLVTRDLRRSGYFGAATDIGQINPYAAIPPGSAASDVVGVRYSMDATENDSIDSNEQFGFRLRAGVIELQLGAGNWQALTDANTLTITRFAITPDAQTISLAAFCPRACAAGTAACPPHQQVLGYTVDVGARLVSDVAVNRSLRSTVRVRNDALVGACGV